MENILLYGIIGLAVIIICLIIWMYTLTKKLQKLSTGKKSSSLESIIIENNEIAKKITQEQKNNASEIKDLHLSLAKTIQKISIIRFNALGDAGGKQSFAIGLTDAHKNGVVISSMYTRGSMNVFAKEIIQGSSKHKLTEEEKHVIQ